MLRNAKKNLMTSGATRWLAIAIIAFGLSTSLGAAMFSWHVVSERAKSEYQLNAGGIVTDLRNQVRFIQARLYAISGLFAQNESVLPQSFERFASSLEPIAVVQAVEFIRRLPGEDFDDYIAKQSLILGSPFQVNDRDDAGALSPATRKDTHYIVEHVFPMKGNEKALGLDVASNRMAAKTIMAAMETGGFKISNSFSLVQNDNEHAFLILYPITGPTGSNEFIGLASALVNIKDLISFVRSPQAKITRISRDSWDYTASDADLDGSEYVPIEQEVEIGEDTWRVMIGVARNETVTSTALIVFSFGVLMTALMLGSLNMSNMLARYRSVGAKLDLSEKNLIARDIAYKAIFDNAATANVELDLASQRIIRSNASSSDLTGYEHDTLNGRLLLNLFHPDDRSAMQAALEQAGSSQLECRLRRKDGSDVWVLASLRSFGDKSESSESSRANLIMQDISSQKDSESARDLLVRELAHRLRNTMQLVVSLAEQTARSVDTADEYLERFRGRLYALNSAQDALFETNWAPIRLDFLANRILEPFQSGPDDNRIEVDVVPITLHAQESQTIALAIHELASNAVRHGALQNKGGHITFRIEQISQKDGNSGKTLHLVWKETVGNNEIATPSHKGFGSVMLEKLLAQQYDGQTKTEWDKTGLSFEAWLPLRENEVD